MIFTIPLQFRTDLPALEVNSTTLLSMLSFADTTMTGISGFLKRLCHHGVDICIVFDDQYSVQVSVLPCPAFPVYFFQSV